MPFRLSRGSSRKRNLSRKVLKDERINRFFEGVDMDRQIAKQKAFLTMVMRAVAGAIPVIAQNGLKDSWKARGYFLACACVPENDIEVAAPAEGFRFGAAIRALKALSPDVLHASLAADKPIDFRAGQYVTVVRSDGLARSYSIASLPDDGVLDLHIRRVPNGRMSGWFHTEARIGDRVTLLGPSGECFYVAGRETQPMLLAGTGTGLAPLFGIVRDALRQGHRGPLHLFHGALHREGLYLVEELRDLTRRYSQLLYTPMRHLASLMLCDVK